MVTLLRRLAFLVVFAIAACDSTEEVVGDPDTDGDGLADALDCAPNDATIPGTESCDGVDNDCDGATDEGFDGDGDGVTSCATVPDCDDANPARSPLIAETCDGVDNDCDNATDEGFDTDGDGVTTCATVPDCDDANPARSPLLTETCDGIDNDCNDGVDEGFDTDGDDVTTCAAVPDCDDSDPARSPLVTEVCDGVDNDCNDGVDEDFDTDTDGVTTCGGDCNDDDPEMAPGLQEVADGKDNDCSGSADEPFIDADGDGYTPLSGDCNDADPDVNPGAMELAGNMQDDDCDGADDEPRIPCDDGALNATASADYVKALGLCNGELQSSQLASGTAQSRALVAQFGSATSSLNVPLEGAAMVVLSSGTASSATHDPGTAFDGTTGGGCTTSAHPARGADPGPCGAADPVSVCDATELRMTLRVPTNAHSMSFRFQFWTPEYPTFRCGGFDDTFVALLSSNVFPGATNIAFDAAGAPISVNSALMAMCIDDTATSNDCSVEDGAAFAGTGFFFDNDVTNDGSPDAPGSLSIGAAATLPLTTRSPVIPGETIVLRFIIFDEGDDALDSLVVLDDFQWHVETIAAPVTN